MSSQATSGSRISFKRGDGGSPEAFTKIAEVTSVTGPGLKRNIVDTTNMDSNGYVEKLPTEKDPGQIQLELNFLPGDATQNFATGFLGLYDSGTLTNFRVVWPSGQQWTCPCYVTGCEPSGAVGAKMTYKVTLEVSGTPVLQ